MITYEEMNNIRAVIFSKIFDGHNLEDTLIQYIPESREIIENYFNELTIERDMDFWNAQIILNEIYKHQDIMHEVHVLKKIKNTNRATLKML